jgi:hypothetical protein
MAGLPPLQRLLLSWQGLRPLLASHKQQQQQHLHR